MWPALLAAAVVVVVVRLLVMAAPWPAAVPRLSMQWWSVLTVAVWFVAGWPCRRLVAADAAVAGDGAALRSLLARSEVRWRAGLMLAMFAAEFYVFAVPVAGVALAISSSRGSRP